MIRAAKWFFGGVAIVMFAPVVIVVATPLLLWLGRPIKSAFGELVVDPDVTDDLGTDVDEDERTP